MYIMNTLSILDLSLVINISCGCVIIGIEQSVAIFDLLILLFIDAYR